MLIKIKKVYYCEYCKKHFLRPMKVHELHCTMNPNRTCRLCGRTESLTLLINKWRKINKELEIDKKKEIIKDDFGTSGIPADICSRLEKRIHFSKIQKDLEFLCPLCTFSIIRQVGLNRFPFDTKFDFEKELKEWWENKNAEQAMLDEESTRY